MFIEEQQESSVKEQQRGGTPDFVPEQAPGHLFQAEL